MKQSSVWWQYVLPQRFLSRCAGRLAHWRCAWLKNWAIMAFSRRYGVALHEAEIEDPRQFINFNDFFTRRLKPGVRPLASNPQAIISPVDGCVSEMGKIKQQQILQAKAKYYSLESLLGGGDALAEKFVDGNFMTAYLAPKDYHRIHMPCDGRLITMRYIPGNLFSVNQSSAAKVDQLFARNERVVCLFDSAEGPFAVIAIGAMIVGSIVTVWHGVVNAAHGGEITEWDYESQAIQFKRGDEMGYFQLGSTVVLLFAKEMVAWAADLGVGSILRLGQEIALLQKELA